MPYKLKKVAGKLQLMKGSQVLAKNTTPERARKQISAIEISEKKRTPKKEKKEHKEMNEYKRNLGKHHPALATKYLMN
jgi:hypothetical protein